MTSCSGGKRSPNLSFRLDGDKICGRLGRIGAGKSSQPAVPAAFRKATAGEVTIRTKAS